MADQWNCSIVIVALRAAFGSLYSDEVIISPGRVTPLLAAACMLQLVSTIALA